MYKQITITDYILLNISAQLHISMKSVFYVTPAYFSGALWDTAVHVATRQKTIKCVTVKSGPSEPLFLLKMINAGG